MGFLDDRYVELRDLLNDLDGNWTEDINDAPIENAVVNMADKLGAIAPDLAAVDSKDDLWRLGID